MEDIIEESYIQLDILEETLEDRRSFIDSHDKEMEYLCKIMAQYVEDVNHTVDMIMTPSIVSHLTYNLILCIANGFTDLTIYSYLRGAYMLDDEYDTIHKIWEAFREERREIVRLTSRLRIESYFGGEDNQEKFESDINLPVSKNYESNTRYFNLQRRLANSNGTSLINILEFYVIRMDLFLSDLKNGIYYVIGDDYDKIFNANYNLYKKIYWPKDGSNFRDQVISSKPRCEDLNEVYLKECLRDERSDFFHTPPGRLWRYYSSDKKKLYFGAKEIKMNEEQWLYFFKCICRFEEYEDWIEELRNPPESEKDKQKRERLLKSNKVFNLQPSKSKHIVDILLLYQFIRDRFITEKMFIYEWYALYFILRRVGVITTCTIEDFEKQMNDEEWFANIEKKCSANEINTYSFLTDKSPDDWDIKYKPEGTNKASKKAINNIYRKYSDLEDTIGEIYIKE